MRALFATEPKYAGAIHFSGHGREGISYPFMRKPSGAAMGLCELWKVD